ncbi:BCL2 associated agonist of cell death b [Cynoglossus semilaevis]|nr:bcl2-associated agonist of cell death [Cynoglossus semilaevis]
MAAQFTISDSESEPEEEVEGGKIKHSLNDPEQVVPHRHNLTLPELRVAGSRRIRLNSESHASTISREEAFQSWGEEEAGTPTEGAPFRGRSRSAPPALWAAKKYGRQLRRMSDEFDSLLDKGMRKVKSAGTARQMHHSKSWWSYLFSHQELEGENNHHENHTHRTE